MSVLKPYLLYLPLDLSRTAGEVTTLCAAPASISAQDKASLLPGFVAIIGMKAESSFLVLHPYCPTFYERSV